MSDLSGNVQMGNTTFMPRLAADALVSSDSDQKLGVVDEPQVREARDQAALGSNELITLPTTKIDESTLAGPPPTFQISLLELDRALQENLARINAEQGFGAPEVQPRAAEPTKDTSSEEMEDGTGLAASSYVNGSTEASQPAQAVYEPTGRAAAAPDTGDTAVASTAGEAHDDAVAPAMLGQVPGAAIEIPQLDGEIV